MSLSSRLLRLFIPVFLSILPSACLAQVNPQFLQPEVQLTGGRATSFVLGNFQQFQSGSLDLLYVNAFATSGSPQGPVYSVAAGTLLINQNHQFTNLVENRITFPNTVAATAAVADFDGDGHPDFAFALSPSTIGGTNLCVYHGTGLSIGSGSSFGAMGCSTFPTQPNTRPVFGYVVAALFSNKNPVQQLFVEDTANNYIYVLSNNGNLSPFTETAAIAIPAADGSGPIYTGDFNGDGNTDILINNQTGNVATIYFGKSDGTFQPGVPLNFPNHVHSMLIQDMDGDHIPDAVVEGDNGVIQIFKGSDTANLFTLTSEGGTSSLGTGFSGNGGHLAAIGKLGGDKNLDILTTTPIGLSVLLGNGTLQYQLKGIYNAGPGRSIFSLADFDGDGNLDLYLDSPEGIAVVLGNADGSFQTSLAYPAGQPALNATIADVNSDGKPDVVVATGAIQAQILTGNGDGTFNAPTNTNTLPNPSSIPANLWSTVLTGDFDGDGCPDLLYSLTGLPLPTPGSSAGSGLYLQYGNKPSGKCDGTFQPPQAISSQSTGAAADNNFYGESTVGDFNGDGILDIANIDTYYYDTLLGHSARGAFTLGTSTKENANSFSQVAAGFFTTGRTNMQDLVFQDDANIIPYVNKRDGSGNFTAMLALSNPPAAGTYYEGTILIADIDRDGFSDIIVPYHNLAADPANPSPNTPNLLYIWYGNGDGTFGTPQIIPLSRNYYLAQVVDMNSDGFPDIVLSDGYLVSILYNLGNKIFGNEQHFLAGQGINSISIADVDNDGSLDLIVANGGATISNAIAMGGKSAGVSAISLTPNLDVNTGGITVLLNAILTRPVTGSLTATPDPSPYGQSFTLTGIVTPSSGTIIPTGLLTFSINGNVVGSSTLAPNSGSTSSATASFTVPAGNYTGTLNLSATYSGDANYSPLTFYGTQTIAGSATTTTLYLCTGPTPTCPSTGSPTVPNPPYPTSLTMYYGQIFNGVTAATAKDGSLLTGTIAFNDAYNGAPPVTLCTLKVGVASSCDQSVGTTVGTQGGVHVFTAVYSGDTTHTPSSSPAVTINILPDTNVATLIGAPNPQTQGQPVTFTATFTGNFAAPTGTVTFAEFFPPTTSGQLLGTATLVPGPGLTSTATFITSTLPVGNDTITVSYTATPDFNTALATTIETITPALPTITTLTSSQNPSIFSKPVTFIATVSQIPGPGGPVITPTGTVTFLDAGVSLATIPLVNGVATFTTSALTAGTHPITAVASGDLFTSTSTSAVLIQIVDPLPPPPSTNFNITVTPSPITVGVGNAATLTVTITPLNGSAQPVNLACSNLPYETACTFVNPTIPAGGGTTTLLLSTMAPHNCGSTQPYFTGSNTHPDLAPLAVPMLAGLAVLFIPGKRRWLRALIAMVAIASAMQITGCGTCTDLGTRPNTYTIQVTGTASGTGEAASQPVTLNVTI